jgi:hypothetical protein
MNVTSEKLKYKKNNVPVESCEHFLTFGYHKSMNAESVIEKL